jgi:hypothetical protein
MRRAKARKLDLGWLITFFSRPDNWFSILGVLSAFAIGGGKFLEKKFGWKFRLFAGPASVVPGEDHLIDSLIERIEELTLENALLKSEKAILEKGSTETNKETESNNL